MHAKSAGETQYNGYYWTRSYIGYSYDDYYASCISDDGAMTIWNVDSVIGMRPAITLKIA